MTGEGMLALWGALKSCLKPGDHVVSVGTGVFGDGVTAALLRAHGIRVLGESQVLELLAPDGEKP